MTLFMITHEYKINKCNEVSTCMIKMIIYTSFNEYLHIFTIIMLKVSLYLSKIIYLNNLSLILSS